MQARNEACKDLGYGEFEQCVLFVGVECAEQHECTGLLEVDYIHSSNNTIPSRVYSNQPKQGILDRDEGAYYYVNVDQEIEDLYGIVQTTAGDADLYGRV